VKGRKRHLLGDTQGLVIKAKVHPADLHDKEGAKLLLSPLAGQLPRMAKVGADSAYQGLKKWLKETWEWDLEVVKHWWRGLPWVGVPEGKEPPVLDIPGGFEVLPRSWVVERSFGWLGRNRRLSQDYEFLPATEEGFIYLGMVRLMLRRLAKEP
jgi:putative transposase